MGPRLDSLYVPRGFSCERIESRRGPKPGFASEAESGKLVFGLDFVDYSALYEEGACSTGEN